MTKIKIKEQKIKENDLILDIYIDPTQVLKENIDIENINLTITIRQI